MQIDANRKSTFLGTPAATFLEAVPVKRTTKSKPAAIPTNGPRWPHTATTHPRLTPEDLARAGYYYAPEPVSKPSAKDKAKTRRTTSRVAKSTTSKASTSRAGRKTKASSTISDTDPSDTQSDVDEPVTEETDDQCCCFTCGKKLGGWDETDDPYEEHWKRSEGVAIGQDDREDIACAWATAVCSVVIHVKKWKEGALASGKSTTGKRSKTKQPPTDVTAPYIYPKTIAHLHPQSRLMTRARQQTYHPSTHITSQTPRDERAKPSDAGWWPHKVKRAWLCTVPNLAKAGFVYTPTIEEKDCVTCFYCNYSVSDWEPTDDPWKQHYDKSPNCPFFTEGIEGQVMDEIRSKDGVGNLDDTVDELADLPTVRSRAAVGSKRPTSRTTIAKARRTTTTTAASASNTLDRSTTRSRIPKSATSTVTPRATRIPDSTPTSDNDDAREEPPTTTKARPKRGTTTSKAPVSTAGTARKVRTAKTKADVAAAPSGDDADDFDELPLRVEKSKSQNRSKSSKTASVVSASEGSVVIAAPPVKKAPAARKGKTASQVRDAEMSQSETRSIPKLSSKKVSNMPSASATTHAPPSPPSTASETASETEQEEFDADERAEYLKEEEVVKSNRLQMVEAGAKEAMAVLQNLGSKRAKSTFTQADDAATPRPAATTSETDAPISLTAEEEEMTVVEYVRRMYALRQAALRAAGEDKIRDWQDRAKQAREFIQSIPARDH